MRLPRLPALFAGLPEAPLCVERTAGAGFEHVPQSALLSGHHAYGPGVDTSRTHARPGRDPALSSPYPALTLPEPSGILEKIFKRQKQQTCAEFRAGGLKRALLVAALNAVFR